jgi:hypothetical protein
MAMLVLSGCGKAIQDADARLTRHGRYVGIGIYPAGQMWSRVVMANTPKHPAAPRLSDDEQVIVVVDTASGEVRQCGNISGYCVGMNPWRGPLPPSQTAPVPVTKHADQVVPDAPPAAKPAATDPGAR